MTAAQRCPNCGELTLTGEAAPGGLHCSHCGAHIVQGQLECPSCQSLNPIGTELCMACAEPLTIFGRVLSRQGLQVQSKRLEQMRNRAGEIKDQALKSSDIRMAGFREIDQRRIESEQAAMQAQRERDRRLFRYVAFALGLFMLIVAVISLVVLL